MNRATISTHVLDTALGRPAAGIPVTLRGREGAPIGEAVTGADGRIADLVPDGLRPGVYLLTFETGAYFAGRPHLFEIVSLSLTIAEASHHHVPLLIGPYSCVTYRGS